MTKSFLINLLLGSLWDKIEVNLFFSTAEDNHSSATEWPEAVTDFIK